ncbi:MAG: 6-bladed beta-propeller [Muribaculaceae bacterium]|nr:6-bladed beta-propeller [Muribaculaceae bacterium]
MRISSYLLCASAIASALWFSACSESKKDIVVIPLERDLDAAATGNAVATLACAPEFTDSTMLKSVNLVGVKDNRYYVNSKNLMIFDKDGRCITSFNKVGNGPGEYTNPKALWMNPSTGGWMVNTWPDVVNTYTADGNFIGSDSILSTSGLTPLRDGWIATNNCLSGGEIAIYYLDRDFNLTDSVLTGRNHKVIEIPGGRMATHPNISVCGDNAYIEQSDTLYNISYPDKGLVPMAFIDLGSHKMPADMNPMDDYDRDAYITYFSTVCGNQLLLYYRGSDQLSVLVYDLTDGYLISCLRSDPDFTIPFVVDGKTVKLSPTNKSDGKNFWFTATEDVMAEFFGTEDVNPALFSVKFE